MMASIEEVLFEAIDAGDTDRVRGLLTAEPSLASARDVERLRELLGADPAAANDPEERGTGWMTGTPPRSTGTRRSRRSARRRTDPTASTDDGISVLDLAERSGDPATIALVRVALRG